MKTLNYLFTLGLLGSAILYAENEPIKKEDLLIVKSARSAEQTKKLFEHVQWCQGKGEYRGMSQDMMELKVEKFLCDEALSFLMIDIVKHMPIEKQKEALVEFSRWTYSQK